jgi:hypothetical protein
MKFTFTILLVAFTFTVSLGQTLTPKALKSDLVTVKNALESRHPEMYRYTTREHFDSLYRSIESQFSKPMTVPEFYLAVSPLISSIKCGHTKWLLSGKDYYYPFYTTDLFPLRLYFTKGKAFVISHYLNQDAPILSEVVSINGISIENLIARLFRNLAFGDGFSTGGKYYELNNYFPGILSTYVGTSAEYTIEYINPEQRIETKTFSGVSFDAIKSFIDKQKQPDEAPYSFSIIDTRLAWMDINRFYSFRREPDYFKFLKKSFAELTDKNVENLVIDLRGNEGGNEDWGIELYRYLARDTFRYYENLSVCKMRKSDFKEQLPFLVRLLRPFIGPDRKSFKLLVHKWLKTQKPKKDAFHGKVYLLLDGQSYSVTTEFASKAKSDGRVVVIGQESAGGYALNTSGLFSIVALPNSKVELGIPLFGFSMRNDPAKNPFDCGILPDYEVEKSPADIINGSDPVREFVIKQVGTK